MLSIQVQSESELSVVISGSTWNYRNQFASLNVGGGYANPDAEDKGPYVRTMKDLDVSKEENRERIAEVLDSVLNNLACRLVVDGEIEEDSPVEHYVSQLRQRPNLHFHEVVGA